MDYMKNGREFLANLDQFSYARQSVLSDGPGRGQRIIDIFNGQGLSCTVNPDRGLNVVECSCFGIPLAYRAPGGHRASTGFFQLDWPAGLFTTCGLHNIGVPSMGEPQHGRISTMAADDVAASRENGDIVVRGRVREGWLFGPNLELVRKMTFSCRENTILIEDTVTNLAAEPDDLAILYHCNFGYPLIAPGIEFDTPAHAVEPRDAEAAKGIDHWNEMDEPVVGYKEQCFRHKLVAGADGMAKMRIINRKLGMAATVAYDTKTIHQMVQWKNCMTRNYVLGLEPAVGSLMGREADLRDHQLIHLECDQSVDFKVKFTFEKLA